MGLTLRLCQGPAMMSGTEAAFGSPFSQLPMQLLESFPFLTTTCVDVQTTEGSWATPPPALVYQSDCLSDTGCCVDASRGGGGARSLGCPELGSGGPPACTRAPVTRPSAVCTLVLS